MGKEKYYTEDIPVDDRTCVLIDKIPTDEEGKALIVKKVKDFIYSDVYPRRVLSAACNLSIGEGSIIVEFACSNAMALDSGFQRERWADSVNEALQNIADLLSYTDEAVYLI